MARRWTNTFRMLAVFAALACCRFGTSPARAQDAPWRPPLVCPLAENQCSDYLYTPYDGGSCREEIAAGGFTHDMPVPPVALKAPAVTAKVATVIPAPAPAFSDDLAGHDADRNGCHALGFQGCGDYSTPSGDLADSYDYWGESRNLDTRATPAVAETRGQDQDPWSRWAWDAADPLLGEDPYDAILAFEGSLYRQEGRQSRVALPEQAASDQVSRDWKERAESWNLLMRGGIDDYVAESWQLLESLADFIATDRGTATTNREIARAQDGTRSSLGLDHLRAAPALARTYGDWIASHRYVQDPSDLRSDLIREVEYRLCGTPALEKWLKYAYGRSHDELRTARPAGVASVPRAATESHAGLRRVAEWLDHAGLKLQQVSRQIEALADRPVAGRRTARR